MREDLWRAYASRSSQISWRRIRLLTTKDKSRASGHYVTGPFYGQWLSNTIYTLGSQHESRRSEWCCSIRLFEKPSIPALTDITSILQILTKPYNNDMTMERQWPLVQLLGQVYLMPRKLSSAGNTWNAKRFDNQAGLFVGSIMETFLRMQWWARLNADQDGLWPIDWSVGAPSGKLKVLRFAYQVR